MDGAWPREAASFLEILHVLCENDSRVSSLCSPMVPEVTLATQTTTARRKTTEETDRSRWTLQPVVWPRSPDLSRIALPNTLVHSSSSLAWVSA